MEQTPPPPSAPQTTGQQPPPEQPQSQTPQNPQPPQTASSSPSLPSSSLPLVSPSTFPLSPNPNPTPPTTQLPQSRSPFNRQWPPQQSSSPFPQFPSHIQSMPPHSSSSTSSSAPSTPPVPSFSSAAPSSVATPPAQRTGGMAIGVPAHHQSTPSPPTSFSSLNPPPFGQQFGMARGASNVPESGPSSNTSQVRQPVQGIQGIGSIGSFSTGQQVRPGGLPLHQQHQQRPGYSSARPQTTQNNQPSTSQSFQGHSLLRAPPVGSPLSPSPSTPQTVNAHNQPWLSSGSQGKPPLPPATFRPQMNPLTLQQRSHISQQHSQSMPTTTPQSQATSPQQQQQPLSSLSPMEHYGQQFPHSRGAQSLPSQQQNQRTPGLGNQKPSHTVPQTSALPSGLPNKTTPSVESGETSNRILSRRSIQELVAQIDPSEKLDPEVEDILMDIAEDFVESITTFGCSLAKHRKSTTLEAKDILLHLERNWNMTLPGFSGDEIKNFRKPSTSDIHRERLAAVRKSMTSSDGANVKTPAGPAAGNTKGSKTPLNGVGSPNPKIREAA